MKKLFPLLIILLSVINFKAQNSSKNKFPVGAQCSSVMNELTDLHKQTVKLFGEKKYDEAYPLTKKMYEIAEGNCIEEKDKRLSLALNVAEIQVKRGKTSEAREIFDKNLTLAGEVYGEKSVDFDNYLTSLIKLSINEVSNERFEQYALKSIEVKKNVFGVESYETAKELLRTAIFHRKLKNFEKADLYYLEAIAVSDKLATDEKVQKLAVINQYRAYLMDRFGEKEGGKKGDEFMKSRFQEFPTAAKRNILNGMAVKLFRPIRSSEAFVIGAKGKVEVEVTIGEDGKVIKAKAISGHPFLRQSSEDAAKSSVFLPTYVDGKAVNVTGIIVYNF